MAKNTRHNIVNNNAIEHIIPSDDTGTGESKAILYINHGKGRLEYMKRVELTMNLDIQAEPMNLNSSHSSKLS